MTINDNSTKSINAAIIDLQNQIKQLQHKIGILSNNQLKEEDIEFPGKVEYADEAGKAKEADHAKTADTAKYTSETENAVHAGYADIATKATQDASGNVITDTYALKSELENTFQDHLIGYIRNKPIYRKVILDSTAYNVTNADIYLINLVDSNRKFIGSGGYVKYSTNGTNYRIYPINSKTCVVEIFDQDGLVYLESESAIVGTNIDIYAWIDYMQS